MSMVRTSRPQLFGPISFTLGRLDAAFLPVLALPFLFAAVDLGFGDGNDGAEQLIKGFERLAVRLARGR
jgi:hypothetical protein